MSATELLLELDRLGIQLEAHGDRLRYWPRSAVTPELVERMKTHKGELLAILRSEPDAPSIERADAAAVWAATLARLEGDPLFPPDAMTTLRGASVWWAERYDPDDELEVIDPPGACAKCGTLELWQTILGNWRCVKCDPPAPQNRPG